VGTSVPNAAPRWIALHRDTEVIGLAFDELHESRRVAARDVGPFDPPMEHGDVARALSRHTIQVDRRVVHVLDIAAVVSAIRQAFHRG
jgi:hypothetical protein